ncbi:MAG: ABC transporter ATP-binding protein [Deltaproteobacteria bacterium]|nr:ABC transporter ATP-binding protein [Deltaproteobacteria bacterium]
MSVIGPNGAGKTTLFNLITGVLKPDEGDIFFKDQRVTDLPPHKLCRLGLTRSFQVTNIFQGLTVFENIRLASQGRTTRLNLFSSVEGLHEPIKEAERILNLLGLWDQRDELAGNLSHGDQRYLEIGMTLAARPSMILLDEPTAGMTPMETRATIGLIKQLKGEVTILLIEHDIDLVFAVSDWILVMNQGLVLAQGSPGDVKANKEVQKAYFGEELDAGSP